MSAAQETPSPTAAPLQDADRSIEALVEVREKTQRDYAQRRAAGDERAFLPGEASLGSRPPGLLSEITLKGAWQDICQYNAPAGIPREPPDVTRFNCPGTTGEGVGCFARMPRRGGYCADCTRRNQQHLHAGRLEQAIKSVNPESARSWCRLGDTLFDVAMRGKPVPCRYCGARPARDCPQCAGTGLHTPGVGTLYSLLPKAAQTVEASAIVRGTAWSRSMGGLLIVGPTGSGKSALLSALALKILDRASKGELVGDAHLMARGIKFTTGLALGQALRRHRLGSNEDPPEIVEAKRAPLLILDEIGYEDRTFDPRSVLDVLKARYGDGRPKPTLVASGRRFDELCEQYGTANIRTIYEPVGRVIDLWAAFAKKKAA